MQSNKLTDPRLDALLGTTQARTLRRFVRATGLAPKNILRLGLELVGLHLAASKPPKDQEAVRLGARRWVGVPAKTRSRLARLAVTARWDRAKKASGGRDEIVVEDETEG